MADDFFDWQKRMDDLTGRTLHRQIDELTGRAAQRQIDELTGRNLQKQINEMFEEVTGNFARQQVARMMVVEEQHKILESMSLANRRLAESALGLGPAIQSFLGRLVEAGEIVGSATETVSRLSETSPSYRAFAIDSGQFEGLSDSDSTSAEVAEIEVVELLPGDGDVSPADERDGRLYLPRDMRERIVRVEFLPFRLHQEIQKKPELIRSLSPRKFERFVADLLPTFGFEDISLTPQSGDGGRDILAVSRIGGIEVVVAFECKKYAESNKIQIDTLRSLLGTITYSDTRANKGVLVTTSTFTSGSRKFIVNEPMIDGKDFDALTAWVTEFARTAKDSG